MEFYGLVAWASSSHIIPFPGPLFPCLSYYHMAWLASNLPIEQVSYQQLIAQQENLLVLDYRKGLFLALVTLLFSNNLL